MRGEYVGKKKFRSDTLVAANCDKLIAALEMMMSFFKFL